MRYINRERAALSLVLLACMFAECIPLLLALVALSALALFLPDRKKIMNFRRGFQTCITKLARTAARTLTRGSNANAQKKKATAQIGKRRTN